MGYTLDQYNQLVGAIAQGATLVKYSDKEVQYRSLNDMLRLKRDMEIELNLPPGNRPTRKYAAFTTGLNHGCGPGRDHHY